MEISYLGLAEGGHALLAAGHRILAAASTERSGSAAAAFEAALARSGVGLRRRPDLRCGEGGRFLVEPAPRLLVCYLWDRILPEALLQAFPEGAVSYHPSLLPRHRGPDPTFWTLWLGDGRAGASVILLDAGVDTGPVVAQRDLGVDPAWTAGDLAERLDPLGLELLVEVVGRWEREGPLAAVPQDEDGATLAPTPSEELLAVRWSRPAEELARLVRAAAPHPGAFAEGPAGALVLLAAHPVILERSGALEPGDAVLLDAGVTVWTAEGGLVLDAVLTEDEEILRGAEVARAFPGLADLRVGQRRP